MLPLKYIRIDEEVIDGLESFLLQGNTAVLIGPRFAGKRTALRALQRRLEKLGMTVAMLDFLEPPVPASDRELCDRLISAIGLMPSEGDTETVKDVLDHISGHMVLFASNVDAMPQQVTQDFLHALEARVEEGNIAAMLTGENDLRQLLGGARSGFSIALHYFVQGFGAAQFREEADRYCNFHRLTFVDHEKCQELLYEHTGGNAQLLRSLLDALALERNRDSGGDAPSAIETDRIREALQRPPDSGHRIFRNATRQMWQEPSCCAQLERLLANPDGIQLDEASIEPTALELAGVAVREVRVNAISAPGRQTVLKFSSPMIADFVRTQYDYVGRGDLYAQNGQWEEAAERYSAAPREQRIRPRSSDDRVVVDLIVRSLCASLHARATEESSVDQVDALFTIGCRWLLGFEEVSWFRRQADSVGKLTWNAKTVEIPSSQVQAVLMFLARTPDGLGLHDLPSEFGDAMGIVLAEQSHAEQTFVVLSDSKYGTRISPVRRVLVSRVIDHYIRARSHAVRVDANSRRAGVLRRYREINNHLGYALGAQKLAIDDVLEFLAERIMPLGYGMFACGYYNRPDNRVICGLYRDGEKTLQVWPTKLIEKQNLEVAQSHNPATFADANGHDYLVIPIVSRSPEASHDGPTGDAQVTHTIMVQRSDFEHLTVEERMDLAAFGEQFMMAIRHGERLVLIESALDEIKEPIGIVDAEFQLRYANAEMRLLFPDSPPGWQESYRAPQAKEALKGARADRIVEMFAQSLRSEGRDDSALTEQIQVADDPLEDVDPSKAGLGLGNNEDYYGRININSIENSRGRIIGAWAHVQDFRDQLTIFRTISLFFAARSEDILHSLLLQYDRPTRAWRRLYRVDRGNPSLLIGRGSAGPVLSESEQEFGAGKITIQRNARTDPSFLCLDRCAPVLFQVTERTGQRTKYGVPIEAVPDPPWSGLLKKHPCDMWLDVPLGGNGKIGKLSMACDEEIRPEQIEYWRLLGEAAGFAMEYLRREVEVRTTAALAAERVFLASMAHNLHTRIASLFTVQDHYALYAEQNPSKELLEINAMFDRFLRNLQGVMDRVKLGLGVLTLKSSRFNLRKSWQDEIGRPGRAQMVHLEPDREFWIEGDERLLAVVFTELVQNSIDATVDPLQLRAAVRFENFEQHDGPWLRICYSDNGPGIPRESKTRIFELFFTNRTNGTVGTGLGLYFTQRVILAHGGSIREEGKHGEGAMFVIELPRGGPRGRT